MYYMIVNPASKTGKGREIWKKVETILLERGISYQVMFSKSSEHVREYVTNLTQRHLEKKSKWEQKRDGNKSDDQWELLRLIVLGGDGTLNDVINAIVDLSDVLLGYIPSGSSNDFARGIGLPKKTEIIFNHILAENNVSRLDVGLVRYFCSQEDKQIEITRRFVVSAGIGFDAAVCQEAMNSKIKKCLNYLKLGKLTYGIIGIRQILHSTKRSCRIILEDGTSIELSHFLFMACMIQKYEGGGFMFGPEADATDGQLDLCVVGNLNRFHFIAALPSAFKGKHFRFRGIDHYRTKKVQIYVQEPLWIHTDGEALQKVEFMEACCEKQSLQLLN